MDFSPPFSRIGNSLKRVGHPRKSQKSVMANSKGVGRWEDPATENVYYIVCVLKKKILSESANREKTMKISISLHT